MPDSSTSRTQLTLSSTIESVDRLEHEAETMATRSGFSEDEASSIAMAVREAAVNAVLHGNCYNPEKHVTATFETNQHDLVICIADEGAGFDASALPDPLSPENILRGSGRGVFLIRTFMDEVHFRQRSPGTELTMVKHRNSQINAA